MEDYMYQVTAVWQGEEIGYGEGESLAYAKEECIESIPCLYDSVLDEIRYIVIQ